MDSLSWFEEEGGGDKALCVYKRKDVYLYIFW